VIYAIYRDDGPQGITPQSMEYTCKWCQLFILDTYDDLRLLIRKYDSDPPHSRKNPRIDEWFSDYELDGGDKVFKADRKGNALELNRVYRYATREELAAIAALRPERGGA